MQIISVISPKGGTGKTSISLALAVAADVDSLWREIRQLLAARNHHCAPRSGPPSLAA